MAPSEVNGDRGLHENLDPTSKLVIPLSKRNSKGLPDFTVLVPYIVYIQVYALDATLVKKGPILGVLSFIPIPLLTVLGQESCNICDVSTLFYSHTAKTKTNPSP